jgi:hypothetical protein
MQHSLPDPILLAPVQMKQMADGRVAIGRSSGTLPAISIEDRNVTGSAGNQPGTPEGLRF